MEASRRRFFFSGLGTVTALLGSSLARAAVCLPTARQTSGPFIPDDFPFREPQEGPPFLRVGDANADLTVIDGNLGPDGKPLVAAGQILYVRGQVVDPECRPVGGATVYLWQADINGHYNHTEDPNVSHADELDPNFQYRASMVTDEQGRFSFKTIKPKYYPLDDAGTLRTAHFHFAVLHPGFERLVTQTYFEGDVLEDIDRIRELNSSDIILAPRGTILPQLRNLIIEFANRPGFPDGPVGEVVFTVRRR